MLRLISYSANVYKRYKMLPIVLVIVTKSFAKANFQDEFTISSEGFLLQASCKFWAKQCFLLTAGAVSNYAYGHQVTLDPMVALGYFTTYHTLQQIPRHHCSNPSLMLLSSTVKEILSKERDETICKSSTTCLLNRIKRNLEHIISDDKNGNTVKKAKSHAKEGLLSIEQLQKDLENNDKATSDVEINTYTVEDAQFIESLSKPGKKRNWKNIFNEGKNKGSIQIIQII